MLLQLARSEWTTRVGWRKVFASFRPNWPAHAATNPARSGPGAGRLTRIWTPLHQSTFAVPVAFAPDGCLVRPSEARRGQRYRCPGCSADVVVRRGEHRRPHFAHRGGDGCSAESTLHRAAKHRLLQVIEEWKRAAGPRPCISRSCPDYRCDGGVVQDLPDDLTHAAAEVRLDDGTIADIVLFRGQMPAAAIEIVVTHRVGDDKASRMTLPWVELSAEEVLDRPYWWVATQDGLQPFTCPACARRNEAGLRTLQEIRDRALLIADRLQVSLPSSPPYHYAPHVCWRCGSEMLAFLWPGGGAHSARRPPEPIPSSVQHRVTDGGGDYWANCCPTCRAVQGDYYLARDNPDYEIVRESSESVELSATQS